MKHKTLALGFLTILSCATAYSSAADQNPKMELPHGKEFYYALGGTPYSGYTAEKTEFGCMKHFDFSLKKALASEGAYYALLHKSYKSNAELKEALKQSPMYAYKSCIKGQEKRFPSQKEVWVKTHLGGYERDREISLPLAEKDGFPACTWGWWGGHKSKQKEEYCDSLKMLDQYWRDANEGGDAIVPSLDEQYPG